MKAWYFSDANKRLSYGDGRKIKTGITHKIDGTPVLCKRGLHGSERIIDALHYAPSAYLWLVQFGGEIVKGDNKCAAAERTYLAGFDATDMLREFARRQALINIEKIKKYCTDDDYALIIRWLNTGDDSILDAANAASSAANAARYGDNAAWYAAISAATAAWSAANYADALPAPAHVAVHYRSASRTIHQSFSVCSNS